jgi:acyl carrier protein
MATHQTTITKRVYELLQEYLGNTVTLSPESDLLNDLGMDSLEQVELGLKLEKVFRIKIPIAKLRSCVTVEEVDQLVQHTVHKKDVVTA